MVLSLLTWNEDWWCCWSDWISAFGLRFRDNFGVESRISQVANPDVFELIEFIELGVSELFWLLEDGFPILKYECRNASCAELLHDGFHVSKAYKNETARAEDLGPSTCRKILTIEMYILCFDRMLILCSLNWRGEIWNQTIWIFDLWTAIAYANIIFT